MIPFKVTFLLTVPSFLRLGSSDSGYNSTEACSEATEMEYLRKVLFEYMMGRETKVRSSHEPAHVWPVDRHRFMTVTDTRKMHECVSRCISMTASVIPLDCCITLLEALLQCNDRKKSISFMPYCCVVVI